MDSHDTGDVHFSEQQRPEVAYRSSSGESGGSFTIQLGPTSTLPGRLGTSDPAALRMSRRNITSWANCASTANCVSLRDYMRFRPPLAQEEPQLSFGSALHVGDGVNAMCLVCSALAALSFPKQQRLGCCRVLSRGLRAEQPVHKAFGGIKNTQVLKELQFQGSRSISKGRHGLLLLRAGD